MIEALLGVVLALGGWAYVLVFLAATLESAAFLGFFVPGETIVVFAGFLVAAGLLDPAPLLAVVAGGAILGDSIGYELGRWLGRPWLERHARRVPTVARMRGADDFFARHGGKTVLLARFVGFLRAAAPFLAGASRMSYARFLLWNATGGVLWALVFVGLGVAAGESWRVAERWVGRLGAVTATVVVLVAVTLWVRHRRRTRKD